MKYALFLGCTVPVRGLNYEISARAVAKKLEIEFVDVPEFSCCGFPVKAVDYKTTLIMAAKNLAIAEQKKLDICTLCSACTSVLTESNKILIENPQLMEEVNNELKKFNLKYSGKIKVKHFSRVLYDDITIEKLKEKIEIPLTGIRLAAHYGCHYLKPSEIYNNFENPENPFTFDELIELVGAESPNYRTKKDCCGGGVLGIKEETALKMARDKLDNIVDSRIDGIIIMCPFCSIMYEANQRKIGKKWGRTYKLPVLYYPQLLGIALGLGYTEVGLDLNKIPADELFSNVSAASK